MVKYTLCLKDFPRARPEGTHFNSHKANNSLISLIDKSVYSQGSVLLNIPLAWR